MSILNDDTTANAAAQDGDAIDLDAAGDLVGRKYTDAEKQLMESGLRQTRDALPRLRKRDLSPNLEPALIFDPVLPGTDRPGGNIVQPRLEKAPDYDGNIESLAFASVATQAALLAAGKITSVELTKMYLARLKEHGPKLNCVITLTEELALKQAEAADNRRRDRSVKSPLLGIPYGAKDLLATEGIPTTFGVSPFKDQIFDENATVVDRLEKAGAVLLGKLSLGELAMDDTWFGGQTKNPWNLEQGSSGSSAGSCAATAAGLVSFAIGSETLGSIVSPSVRCGTVGLRPTFGRVPRTGALALCRTMDKLGPICRRAHDTAYVLAAIAGPDDRDPTCHEAGFDFDAITSGDLKVGIDMTAWASIDRLRDAKPIYERAREIATDLFGELVEVEMPSDPLLAATAIGTVEVESAESLTELIEADQLKDLVQQDADNWPTIFRRAGLMPAVDYLRMQRVRRTLMQQMHAALAGVDAVLTIPRMGTNLLVTNLTGQPTILCRGGMRDTDNGPMPIQVEVVGQLFGEAAIIKAATMFEARIDERDAWPEGFQPS